MQGHGPPSFSQSVFKISCNKNYGPVKIYGKKILKNNTCHVSWHLGRQKEKRKRSEGIIGNIMW